jgi:hypothetical protein
VYPQLFILYSLDVTNLDTTLQHLSVFSLISMCLWVMGDRHGHDRMVVGFIIIYAISAYHY